MPNASQMKTFCILVAAGASRRYGKQKLRESLGATSVLSRSITTVSKCVDDFVVVCSDELATELRGSHPGLRIVTGGETRSASVRAGLAVANNNADVIVIHDAARPLASTRLFQNVIMTVCDGADAAIPAIPVTNTVKRIAHEADRRVVVETLDRQSLVEVQTPQAFRADLLRRAHEHTEDATDDAALIEGIGGTVVVVEGEPENMKLTTQTDLTVLNAIAQRVASPTRTQNK